MDEEKTVFEKLYEANRENFTNLVKDLLAQGCMHDVMEKTFQDATQAREEVARNMEAILSLLNIPSRTDYEHLVERVEEVQGNLLNLNMKLDRLLAKKDKTSRRSTGKKKEERLVLAKAGVGKAVITVW